GRSALSRAIRRQRIPFCAPRVWRDQTLGCRRQAPFARNELTALCDQPPRHLTLAAPHRMGGRQPIALCGLPPLPWSLSKREITTRYRAHPEPTAVLRPLDHRRNRSPPRGRIRTDVSHQRGYQTVQAPPGGVPAGGNTHRKASPTLRPAAADSDRPRWAVLAVRMGGRPQTR